MCIRKIDGRKGKGATDPDGGFRPLTGEERAGVLPSERDVQLAEILQQLKDAEYGRWLPPEHEALEDPERAAAAAEIGFIGGNHVKIILEGSRNDGRRMLSLDEIRERLEMNSRTGDDLLAIEEEVSEEGLAYLLESGNSLYFSLPFLLDHWDAVQKNKREARRHFYYDPLLAPVYPKLREHLPGKNGVLRARRISKGRERKYPIADLVFLEELFGPVRDLHMKSGREDAPVSHHILAFAAGEGTMGHYEWTAAPYLKENFEFEFSFEGGVICWNSENADPFLDLAIPGDGRDSRQGPGQAGTPVIRLTQTDFPEGNWAGRILENARPLSEKTAASIERFRHFWMKGEKG